MDKDKRDCFIRKRKYPTPNKSMTCNLFACILSLKQAQRIFKQSHFAGIISYSNVTTSTITLLPIRPQLLPSFFFPSLCKTLRSRRAGDAKCRDSKVTWVVRRRGGIEGLMTQIRGGANINMHSLIKFYIRL